MKKTSLILSAALLASAFSAPAITNTTIAVSSTNLVLSWPSHGYESYLIQYRQTLDPTDAWSTLANAYPANSTNRTTFTIYGAVPPPNTNGGSGGGGGGLPPAPAGMMRAGSSTTSEPMAMPADGSGAAVPLALYPPGLDLSGFVLFDPATGQWLNGKAASSLLATSPMGGASPMDAGEDDTGTATGFYRVFHIPDWLVSLGGYTFDGPTFLPVDFAEPDAPTNYVDNVTVLINGQPMDYTQFMPYDINGTTYWGLGIYFDRLPNGTNTIQLLTTVRQSDELSDQTPYLTFSNAPQTIVIGNTVSFTNWSDLIWNNTNCTFTAQTTSNVDWEIDVYDVSGNFVNSQIGHSDDGNISWTWDLTDYNGNSRNDDSDPYFYPYIIISQNSGTSGQIHANGVDDGEPDPMPPIARAYPDTGAWIVSYMDNNFTDGRTNFTGDQPYYSDGVGSIIGAAAVWSIPVEQVSVKFGRVYTQTERDDSWNNLKAWLQEWHSRNFYYFGHGWPTGFGGDINTLNNSNNVTGSRTLAGSKAYVTDSYVRQNITVNPYSGSHPYRFVFLDGCSGAAGDMPDAFGIPKQQLTDEYYRSSANTRHVHPSAFVGWNGEIGYNINGWGTIEQLWDFRNTWIGQWSLGGSPSGTETLSEALAEAKLLTQWAQPSQIDAFLRIYGDKDLQYRQYNHSGDWP